MSLVRGLHHITVCAAGAQEDIDFMTQVCGQRLIKQTVLFDGRYAHYHLYYANADCEPGSVYTTFPFNRVKGRPGSGQIQSTAYTVPKGSVKFWDEHVKRHKVPNEGVKERFGQKYLRFSHPSGLQIEVIEDDSDKRKGWTTDQVSSDVTMRGFHGPVLSVREIGETERFFVDALGFKKTGTEGGFHRFEVAGGGPAQYRHPVARARPPLRQLDLRRRHGAPRRAWIWKAMKSWPNRRPSTKSWATPIARRSRTATISTRFTAAAPAGFWWNARPPLKGLSPATKIHRSSARTCCCRPGSRKSAPKSWRCSIQSSSRKATFLRAPRRSLRPHCPTTWYPSRPGSTVSRRKAEFIGGDKSKK